MWPKLAQAIINRNKVIGGDNPAGLNLFVITYTALETPHSDSDLGGERSERELARRCSEDGARARARSGSCSLGHESRDPGAGPSLVPAYFRDIQRWKVGKVVFFIHYDTRHSQSASPKHTL